MTDRMLNTKYLADENRPADLRPIPRYYDITKDESDQALLRLIFGLHPYTEAHNDIGFLIAYITKLEVEIRDA